MPCSSEDEFLELGRVHLAAQNVRGFEKKALKLSECDLVFGHSAL